jgi:hypothetical protein
LVSKNRNCSVVGLLAEAGSSAASVKHKRIPIIVKPPRHSSSAVHFPPARSSGKKWAAKNVEGNLSR